MDQYKTSERMRSESHLSYLLCVGHSIHIAWVISNQVVSKLLGVMTLTLLIAESKDEGAHARGDVP